jgi:ribosomal protein S18 acetylase RimI-like enzyme
MVQNVITPSSWKAKGRPMSDLTIRAAVAEDLSDVRRLLAATWHDTYDALLGTERVTATTSRWHAPDVLANQSALPHASFLVALQEGVVVGHAFAVEQGDDVLLLSRLYVLPTHQRQGIGEALLAAVIERHPETVRVDLVVEARNVKGMAFYGRHGFVVAGTIEEEGSCPLLMQMVVKA